MRDINQHTNNQSHWNTIWGKEGKDTWRTYSNLYGYIINLLPEEGNVIDLGCGNGAFLGRVRREKPKLNLTGLDISTTGIQQLKEFYGIDGIVSKLPEIPYPIKPDHFQFVTMIHTLEHIPDEQGAMRAAHRICKPDGLMVVAVPSDNTPEYRKDIEEKNGEHVRWYDEEKLIKAMSSFCKNIRVDVVFDPADKITKPPFYGTFACFVARGWKK